MIIEETSVSTHDSRNKPSSASSFKNKYASEFCNNDFHNCEIIVNTEKSRRFSSLYFFSFFYIISNFRIYLSYFIHIILVNRIKISQEMKSKHILHLNRIWQLMIP